MLIDFTVENCLSFRYEQEFTMRRKPAPRTNDPEKLLSPIAAIYGDNASGKTNLLRCMNFFSNFVRDSFRYTRDDIDAQPFALDSTSAEQASVLYAEFIADDGNRYQYWFRIDSEQVLEETLWLFRKETGRKSVVFERELGQETKFGAQFRGMRPVVKLTRKNVLLLSVAAASGIEAIMPAYREITEGIRYYGPVDFNRSIASFVHRIRQNPEKAHRLAQLIAYADFGITDVDFEEKDPPREVIEMLRKSDLDGSTDLSGDNGNSSDADIARTDTYKMPQILFSHRGDGVVHQFPEQWESAGTKNALLLLSIVLDSLEKPSLTLLDEPDISISSNLMSEIIRLYQDTQTNPHHSQLIFTSHDLTLISASGADERMLDRDQIWIVNKDHRSGASTLNWLMDWSPRENENFGKNYQHGVYAELANPSFHDAVKGFFNSPLAENGNATSGTAATIAAKKATL